MIAILGQGRVGSRIARALEAKGEETRGSHRDTLDLDDASERRERALHELTRGARLLVWAASRYDAGLLAAATVPVLLLGTTSVYGQEQGETVDEAAVPPKELERAARCVLRLAGLYARGRGPQNLLSSAPRSAEGRPRLEPPGERLLNLIHEEDAARAAVFAIERGLEGVWNVSDGRPLARADFYALACRHLGLPAPVFDAGGGRPGLGRRISNAKLLGAGFALAHPDVSASIALG